jgi:hypothetical protein
MDDVVHPNQPGDGDWDGNLPPAPALQPDVAIPRPKAVDTAFQLSLASTAVGAVSTVVTMLLDSEWLHQTVRQTLSDSGLATGETEVNTMISTFQVAIGLGVVVFVGLFVLFAMKMRAGRNWARIVLTVFAGISGVSFLSGLATAGADLALMWSLADAAFSLAAVFYMFRPESTKYFMAHKELRMRRYLR